jgi:hypothetical protein
MLRYQYSLQHGGSLSARWSHCCHARVSTKSDLGMSCSKLLPFFTGTQQHQHSILRMSLYYGVTTQSNPNRPANVASNATWQRTWATSMAQESNELSGCFVLGAIGLGCSPAQPATGQRKAPLTLSDQLTPQRCKSTRVTSGLPLGP